MFYQNKFGLRVERDCFENIFIVPVTQASYRDEEKSSPYKKS